MKTRLLFLKITVQLPDPLRGLIHTLTDSVIPTTRSARSTLVEQYGARQPQLQFMENLVQGDMHMTVAGARILQSVHRARLEILIQRSEAVCNEIPSVDVQAIRVAQWLSQKYFADRYGLRISTLRDWEQGRREPDQATRVLLRAIQQFPNIVANLVARMVPKLPGIAVNEIPNVDIRAIRIRSGLSQVSFANRYGLKVSTLRDWEQQRRKPDQATRILFLLLEQFPWIVAHTVESITATSLRNIRTAAH